MRKFLIILVGVIVGAVVFGAGAFAILLLITRDDVSIDLRNSSGTNLHNVAVIIRNSPWNDSTDDMPPGGSMGFAVDRHTRLPIRVVFDAGGRHYDLAAEVRLPPVGDFVVIVTINEHLQLTIERILI